MAMINASQAQSLLSCDEATFSNYVNNGTLRSQRVDGELMVEEADVQALLAGSAADSSDSILVLDGESEDLSIDLGGDGDNSATIFDAGGDLGSGSGTDQITFGDELEVVNFDDGGTEQLDFGDDSEQTVSFDDSEMTVAFDDGGTEQLSFTESNTAVLTDVEDTMAATATSDYQTVEDDYDEPSGSQRSSGISSVRRSVRAERVRPPVQKVSIAWMILLIITLVVSAIVVAPYYGVSYWPKENETHYNGDKAYGIDDNGWANFASLFVGFDVEPDETKWKESHPDASEGHRPLNVAFTEQSNVWRYREYMGKYTEEGERAHHFMITRVEEEETPDGEFKPVRAFSEKDGNPLGEFTVKPLPGQDVKNCFLKLMQRATANKRVSNSSGLALVMGLPKVGRN